MKELRDSVDAEGNPKTFRYLAQMALEPLIPGQFVGSNVRTSSSDQSRGETKNAQQSVSNTPARVSLQKSLLESLDEIKTDSSEFIDTRTLLTTVTEGNDIYPDRKQFESKCEGREDEISALITECLNKELVDNVRTISAMNIRRLASTLLYEITTNPKNDNHIKQLVHFSNLGLLPKSNLSDTASGGS